MKINATAIWVYIGSQRVRQLHRLGCSASAEVQNVLDSWITALHIYLLSCHVRRTQG